ncbi:MAG: hypothetical protein ACREJO_19215 [Phycisphaerales bacterium]
MSRSTRTIQQGRRGCALLVLGAICLLPLACGDEQTTVSESPEEILEEALGGLGILAPVNLDTAAIAQQVHAGQSIQLPFAAEGGRLVQRDVQLTLRNLRAPDLVEFVLKDGVRQQGRTRPLPPPATYQGIVAAQSGGEPGAAVLTVTARVVAGNLLVAPDGWSIIEPLEPMLACAASPGRVASACCASTTMWSTTVAIAVLARRPPAAAARPPRRRLVPVRLSVGSHRPHWSSPSSATGMRISSVPIRSIR